MNPVGILLIAAGIFLEALRIGPDWLASNWLGTALIVLGAVVVIFDFIRSPRG